MTIDKAIAQEKELFEHCKRLYEPLNDEDRSINPLLKNEMEYHKQCAEWLEELKAIKSNGRYVQGNKAGQKIGYNKAIEDFVKSLQKLIEKDLSNPMLMLECKKCGIWKNYNIEHIAEQLKAAGAE